jgi:hypothetical protein
VDAEPNYTARYVEHWRTDDGCEVRLDYVLLRTGGCFEGVDDLLVGWPIGEPHAKPHDYRIFLRDPNGTTPNEARLDADASIPTEARDSGLRWDGYSLWFSPEDDSAVWLMGRDHVERWPLQEPVFGCL